MRRGASVPAMLVDPHSAPATSSGAYPTAADTLRGVYLDHHLDNAGAPEFRGINREIKPLPGSDQGCADLGIEVSALPVGSPYLRAGV